MNPKGEHREEGTDMSLAPLGYRARTKVSETPKKRCRDNRFTKNDTSQVWKHRLTIPIKRNRITSSKPAWITLQNPVSKK